MRRTLRSLKLLAALAVAGSLITGCGPKSGEPGKDAGRGAGAESAPYVQPDFAALAGYPEGWYISPGWPGEYPAGFAVLDKGVTVKARTKPNPKAPQDATCALPQYANYQLWNNPRVSKDALEFFVATKTFDITLNADAAIEFATDAGAETLTLKAGDKLKYLRYLGEGFTVLSFQGKEYDINEAELRDISDIGEQTLEFDEWVRVACEGGPKAWLLYNEVVAEPGIAPSEITGYGEASDLTEADAEAIRQSLAESEALEDTPPDASQQVQ